MKLFGTVEDIIFRNNDNNYTVLNLDSNGTLYTVVGKLPELHVGLYLELDGDFCTNTKYGEQFVAQEVKISQPKNLEAIEKYLGSGLIRGVGEVTANKIVTFFKQDTLDIIEYNPMRLAEIRGISRAKAQEIAQSFSEIKAMQQTLIFLQSHNISTNLAVKIFNEYKQNTINIVKANPYRLVEDIDGVGFLSADKIALKIGLDVYSEFRIKAGIVYTLKEASRKEGHTYLPSEVLIKKTMAILQFEEKDCPLIEKVLHFIEIENLVKVFNFAGSEIAMLTKYYYRELYNARKLTQLAQNIFENTLDFSKSVDLYEKQNNIKLNEEQKLAISTALQQGLSVITGGPGTGKTTIIKAIINVLDEQRKKVLLVAPTGRASKRLSESCNKEAKTIHRALEMNKNSDSDSYFNRNEHNPLDTDVVIVDEVSMVDTSLLYHLLSALRPTCRLVLVGDKDQLPSVDAGNVLKDIIDSKSISVTYLTQIYRQEADSLIITNAHEINQGKMPIIDNSSKDFFFIQNDDPQKCSEEIIDLVSFRLPNYLNLKAEKIQVLAALKAGPCGVENLNNKLQHVLNPYIDGATVVEDSCKFRVGDKVMQITNNYELHFVKPEEYSSIEGEGVYNGDIGFITHIDSNTFEVTVTFEDGKICVYPRTELSQLALAYAITIHKSQGSEFDAVVIPVIAGAPIILTRNLLYTAITRAKKSVVLIGTKQNLARMIHNNYTAKRYTLLAQNLKECMKPFLA